MNNRRSEVLPASITPQSLRWLSAMLLAAVVAGCATQSAANYTIALTPRGGNAPIYGVVTHELPRTTKIVIDIDRRLYMGTAEPTPQNETYGFAFKYGVRNGAIVAPVDGNFYSKAILSSSDRHVLRCDLVYNEGGQRDGLCVDDFERLYDVLLSR